MANNLTLDKNGKISDDDKLYESLDEWFDNDEYEKIVEAVLGVPEKQWSVKLRFRLISAYNNLKEFQKSREQLGKIKPECQKPDELARFFYMSGYILFISDREMAALACFEDGDAADPDDTSGLDLKSEIKDCIEYINQDLDELHKLAATICADVDKRCADNHEKIKPSDEQLAVILGFLPAMRKIPVINKAPGIDNFSLKFKGKDKEQAGKWLSSCFGFNDSESFMKFYHGSRGCNIALMLSDIVAMFQGNPRFDLNELNSQGKRAFFNACTFVKPFYEFLPNAGVLAWDISEKVGFSRLAFACDFIPESDYRSAIMALVEGAHKYFDSTADFMKSLILGSTLYAFSSDEWNIKGAIAFMRHTATLLFQSPLPDIEWVKIEDSEESNK